MIRRRSSRLLALVVAAATGVAAACTGESSPATEGHDHGPHDHEPLDTPEGGDGHGDHDHAPLLPGDGGVRPRPDSGGVGFPALFPVPKIPEENPLTPAKAELGRHLFYDTRLSLNRSQSCASCHRQELAFTDGRPRGIGSTGRRHPRGAMSLANIAYATTLTWNNPLPLNLERQALVPLFGEAPVELGMSGQEEELVARLRDEPRYTPLFAEAFPGEDDPVTVLNITYAIASFERTLQSADSAYDRYLGGDRSALTASQSRGMDLFFSERTECFHCHGDFTLTDGATFAGKAFEELHFHNTGLYNVDGKGAYPGGNQGVIEFSRKASDMGRFKAPTLRNITVTAPYMHDGSIATLDEVLDHYAAGGRTIVDGPNAGVGSNNPFRSEFVTGFTLSPEERTDLLAFLSALTDDSFLKDPRFADPW